MILGIGFLRAHLLQLCAQLLSLQSFYNYARGHCEAARGFFRAMYSVHLTMVSQYNCACPRCANYSGVYWEEGIGGGGVLLFQEVGTMKSLHWRCEMWFDCVEQKRRAKRLQRLLARSLPRRRSRRACVHSYVHFVCVCVYMCMCVCVRTFIFVYICMCVCICTSMRLYTCVCVCVCIFVYMLWVSVSVLQRVDSVMHVHVCSCAYVCVCICV